MPTSEAVRAELEKILASEAFVNSERLSRFLRFTVEETLQGRGDHLKEYSLGVAVFDRDASYDPRTDPIVRVEAGRLRGKLAAYYESAGRADPVGIEFRKGTYTPSFVCRHAPAAGPPPMLTLLRRLREPKAAALVVVALVAAAAIFTAFAQHSRVRRLESELAAARQGLTNPHLLAIWGPFIAPGAETVVVFGSPMFFNSERYGFFLRVPTLNDPDALKTSEAFRALKERFGELSEPRFGDYASMADAVALQQLTAFFGRAGRVLKAVPSYQAAWETISAGNIIFLGAPRMNRLLERLPYRQDFQVGPPDTYIYNLNPQPGEEKVYSTPSHRDALTYAVAASFPGLRPSCEVMVLAAHQRAGLIGAVSYLTNPDTARALAEKLQITHPGERRHFQLLLRVVADKDVAVKTEYVTHHIFNANPPKP